MPRTFRSCCLLLTGRDGLTVMARRTRSGAGGLRAVPAAGPAAATRPAVPGMNDVVATITVGNQTDKVTKGELINFLSRYPLSDENHEAIYRQGIDFVANTKLLMMFLARQKLAVPAEKVDEEIERLKQRLKSEGQDLATALLQSNTSMDEVRKQIEERLRWQEFLKIAGDRRRRCASTSRTTATCSAAPRSGRATSCSRSNRTRPRPTRKRSSRSWRASRKRSKGARSVSGPPPTSTRKTPPTPAAPAAISTTSRSTPGLIEEFTDVAFKLKKGMISDPVETPFGFHLIQVTDRKEGKDPDFEQNKPYIYNAYATDLQKEVVTAEKKLAKIDIKPMPKDLFPPEAPAAPTAPAGAEKAKTAGARRPVRNRESESRLTDPNRRAAPDREARRIGGTYRRCPRAGACAGSGPAGFRAGCRRGRRRSAVAGRRA